MQVITIRAVPILTKTGFTKIVSSVVVLYIRRAANIATGIVGVIGLSAVAIRAVGAGIEISAVVAIPVIPVAGSAQLISVIVI